MEGGVFPSCLDQFMLSPLVTWVKTFVRDDEDAQLDFSELIDGVILNDIMMKINPCATPQVVNRVQSGDVNQRIQNLKFLVQRIKTYYRDNLRQLILIPLPNVLLIGRTPYCEQSQEEIRKMLLLLLGCAVQCEKKEEYIHRIQTLNCDTKAAIAAHIQELIHSKENMLDLQWLESSEVHPDELEAAARNMATHLQHLLDQRDTYLETIAELMQEKEGVVGVLKSPSILQPCTECSPSIQQLQLGTQQHLAVELAESKDKIRRLRQEVEEKSEEMLDCRHELENTEAELKRSQQERLVDARAARTYRDELDALGERAIKADKLETEVGRCRDLLHKMEFYKTKAKELKEDNRVLQEDNRALQESKEVLEDQLDAWRARLDKIPHLEKHNLLLTAQIDDMEQEREAHGRRIVELQNDNLALFMAQRRSMEETRHLGWELEQLSMATENSQGQRSLHEEMSESTQSRMLKLERENRGLFRTIEELRERSVNGSTTPNRSHHPECDQMMCSSNTETEKQSLEQESAVPERQKRQLEKENRRLRQQDEVQGGSNVHLASLEKEMRFLVKEVKALRERAERVKGLEGDNRELTKQAAINQKTIATLREELVNEKLKTHQRDNELRRLAHDLETKFPNEDSRRQAEQQAPDNSRLKLLELELESSLKQSLRIKEDKMAAWEARLQESFNQNQQLCQELKTNATLEAECRATQGQLKQLESQSYSQQAQILMLQRQAASLQESNTALQKHNANLQSLKQPKGNLEEENRHLLSQIETLMLQNRTLLESKDLFHVEERQYINKVNDLRRQKEKLEEKIMEQYKFHEPSTPRKKGNWISRKLKKLIKPGVHRHRHLLQCPRSAEPLIASHDDDGDEGGSSSAGDTTSLQCYSALSCSLCPLALFEEEQWAGSSERLEGSDANVEEDRRKLLTSPLPTSILSILHLNHPTNLPSDHVTTASTENTDTGPDVSALWLPDKGSHESTMPSGFEDNEELQNHGLNGVQSRSQSESSCELNLSMENEPWSNVSSPVQQPPSRRSSSSYQPPSDASSSPQHTLKLQQHNENKEKAYTMLNTSSLNSDTQRTPKQKDPGLSEDFWLTRGTKSIRRGKVIRRSSASRATVKMNPGLNGSHAKSSCSQAETTQASIYSPITVLYVQGKSSSMSGCLNCFSTPLGKEGRLKGPRSPKCLPRASSVISTAEGSSRPSSVNSNCRVMVRTVPPSGHVSVEGNSQEETATQQQPEPNTSNSEPPVKPPRDQTVVPSDRPKSPAQESLHGSSFTLNSVFSNTIFSDSVVTTTTSLDALGNDQTSLCLNPALVQKCPLESQESPPSIGLPPTLRSIENDYSQNAEHAAGLDEKDKPLPNA